MIFRLTTELTHFVGVALQPVATEFCEGHLRPCNSVKLQINEETGQLGCEINGYLYPLDLYADTVFELTEGVMNSAVAKLLKESIRFAVDPDRFPIGSPRQPQFIPSPPTHPERF